MKLDKFEKAMIGGAIGLFWPLFWLVAIHLKVTKHKYANLSILLAAIMTAMYFYIFFINPETFIYDDYGTYP